MLGQRLHTDPGILALEEVPVLWCLSVTASIVKEKTTLNNEHVMPIKAQGRKKMALLL